MRQSIFLNSVLYDCTSFLTIYVDYLWCGIQLSEPPERRVLKQTLVKLKSKTITSFELYAGYTETISESLIKVISILKENIPKIEDEETKRTAEFILLALTGISSELTRLFRQSIDVVDNWKIYTEVLESYASELDKTLNRIFDEAIKASREQVKKQKELIHKKPEYTT